MTNNKLRYLLFVQNEEVHEFTLMDYYAMFCTNYDIFMIAIFVRSK